MFKNFKFSLLELICWVILNSIFLGFNCASRPLNSVCVPAKYGGNGDRQYRYGYGFPFVVFSKDFQNEVARNYLCVGHGIHWIGLTSNIVLALFCSYLMLKIAGHLRRVRPGNSPPANLVGSKNSSEP